MVKRKVDFVGYDALADSYDYIYGQTKDQELFQGINWLKNRLKNGSQILDVGCGTGRISNYLSKNFKVTGIDNSVEMVKKARVTAPKATFIEMNLKRLKLNDELKFDAIVCYFTLLHIEKSIFIRTIQNLLEFLNRGGIFAFSMILGNNNEEALLENKQFHFTAYSEEELRKIINNLNLQIIRLVKQKFKPKLKSAEEEEQIFIYCQK